MSIPDRARDAGERDAGRMGADDSTTLAGSVNNARNEERTDAERDQRPEFLHEALIRRARQDQTGVDEAGLGRAIDGGRLDRDRVRLLQAAEADDQLVELRLLEAHADAVLAARRLTRQRRAEAALASRAIDEHDQRFVARCGSQPVNWRSTPTTSPPTLRIHARSPSFFATRCALPLTAP